MNAAELDHQAQPDVAADALAVTVRIVTGMGDILVDLNMQAAPLTANAFLEAVDAGCYNGGSFFRTVNPGNDAGAPPITVIQGAAGASGAPSLVPHEPTSASGLTHEDGTISLGRQDGGQSSPLTFFFCVGKQAALDAGGGRTSDDLGFPAFGQVRDGMDVVRAIHSQPSDGEAVDAYLTGQMLDAPVPIYRIAREAFDEAARLSQLCADYWAIQVVEFPIEASAAGEKSAARWLDGVLEADHARRAEAFGALARRAQAIDRSALGPDALLTLDLLQRQLDAAVEEYRIGGRFVPVLYPFGFFDVPDMLLQMAPLATSQQRSDLLTRLDLAPDFLRNSLTMLEQSFARGYRVPRVLAPRILATLDAHLAPTGLQRKLDQRVAEFIDETSAKALQNALVVRVLPALQVVRDRFAALNGTELTDGIAVIAQPGGKDWYRHQVRRQTSLAIEPEAAHQLGLAEVERINNEIDAILRMMGRAGERAQLAQELDSRRATDAHDLLLRTRALAKQVDGLIPQLIGRTPRSPYGVEQMSVDQSRGQPPALALPAPATGERPGVYLLTALPEKCPLHLLVPLTLHEAWPGHLMQLGLANELDQLPAFRRYGWSHYNGYVEGWALYCERLGHDVGLYKDARDRFGLLTFEIWRAVRLVVDTGIHWFDWTRDQAIEFMESHCFLPRETIESEVDRYIGMPAQALSYKIGERVITRLRAETEEALGERFVLRDFHDAVLETGPVSLDALEDHMRRWMEGVMA